MRFLKNINIIDVVNKTCIFDSNILINEQIILSIKNGNAPNGSEIIDCKNLFAIPSYIDMHAHVTFEGRGHNHLPIFDYNEKEEISIMRACQNISEALNNGICAIRDVGAKSSVAAKLKNIFSNNQLLSPKMFFSGEPFCVKNGHGNEFGLDFSLIEDLPGFLKNHKMNGYDWLKIMNGPELIEENILSEIVNQAHQCGLKVSIHAFTKEGIISSIKSRAETIEHSIVINEEMLSYSRKYNTTFVPTFYCAWLSLLDEFIKDIDEQELTYLREWYTLLDVNFKYHIKNKVPIAVGTDAGSAPCTFRDIKSEIQMLHHRGMGVFEALAAATIVPAKILGVNNKFGSIDEGKYANFILLEKNPLDDIFAINNTQAIYYRGVNIFNEIQKPWY